MKNRKLKGSYDYFETYDAIYHIINGKHQYHLKKWDSNPSFKYNWVEISPTEYARAYRSADKLSEDFDKKDVTVTTVDWKKLQRMVNSILEKNGKDIFVEFHSANNRHLSNPYDVFINVFESTTGEVIDDEKLSARYYPVGDVIIIFGGKERRELTSPEEVAENISETVEYWYKQWSR